MNIDNTKHSIVAISCGETRGETVANALAMVRDDILAKSRGRILIKPNFLSSTDALASTQADAVRPLLELYRGHGNDMGNVTIAEGASRSTRQALDRFGYRTLAKEFGIGVKDLNKDSYSRSFEIVTESKGIHSIDYADSVAAADTVVSVALAKTHDTATVTLSVKNMMGCLKRVKRSRMHGIQLGSAAEHSGEALWNIIEDHSWIIKMMAGVVFGAVRVRRGFDRMRHGDMSPGLLAQVAAMSENLARMGAVLMPDIAVIDAFEAMEGEGPGNGTPVPMKIAIAGTDPVTCDAVMAWMMGFEPMQIGYLRLLHDRGLGIADMNEINAIGENPSDHRREFKPHSNYPIQQRWREAWV